MNTDSTTEQKQDNCQKTNKQEQKLKTLIKTECKSTTVEYKDGKWIETRSGVKRINDEWFVLSDNGTWTSSTKEIALEGNHGIKKEVEEPEEFRSKKQEVEPYIVTWVSPFFPFVPTLTYFPPVRYWPW